MFGPDLATDEAVANKIMGVMGRVAGIADLAVYRSLGQPNLLITPDRVACARYGLNVGDVAAVVQAAIGGQAVTQVLEGDRRFDLVVRWLPQYRESLDAIGQIRVTLPAGGYVPLARWRIWAARRARPSSIAKVSNAMCRCVFRCAAATFKPRSRMPSNGRRPGAAARGGATGMGG